MSISGDGNWVNLLNGDVASYKIIFQSTINMTPVDATINPEKAGYISETAEFTTENVRLQIINSRNYKPKVKYGDYVRNAYIRHIFSNLYTSNWYREMFKVN